MKKSNLLLLLLICLTSCAPKPIIVDGNVFKDENYPSVNVNFPFNIYLDDQVVYFTELVKSKFYKMKTDNAYTEVFIQKEEINSGMYVFLGTDDSSQKKPFYLDKKIKGYCSTNLVQDKGYSFVEVEVRKYIGSKSSIKANIYRNVGVSTDKESWQENNTELLYEYIGYTKDLCNQIFDNDRTD